MIKAEVMTSNFYVQKEEIISVLCTLPRIILIEIMSDISSYGMTYEDMSNTGSLSFKEQIDIIETDPFIPIAWQKHHIGMIRTKYHDYTGSQICKNLWLEARDEAITMAKHLNKNGVAKHLCSRPLEPYMWVKCVIIGSKKSWYDFLMSRTPQYSFDNVNFYKSKKEAINHITVNKRFLNVMDELSNLDWLSVNYSREEVHIMDLAEKIYDAINIR